MLGGSQAVLNSHVVKEHCTSCARDKRVENDELTGFETEGE